MDGTDLYRYAVTPGVGEVFFSPGQLQAIGEAAGPGGRIELNSFMQLIIITPHANLDAQKKRLTALGLGIYQVGAAVKNLHTCTFCMGERVEGLPDAQHLDAAIAGIPVPFPVRVGFSGCQANCGEAIVRDIGVVRMPGGTYDIYVGGKTGSLQPLLGQKVAGDVDGAVLTEAVRALLHLYKGTARGKEKYWKTVQRLGIDPFRRAVEEVLVNARS